MASGNTRVLRSVAVCLCAGWILAAGILASQQQAGGQVFRAGTNLVYVDVYPRRDGNFVRGLTRDDFDVFEDGVRQNVQTFEVIEFAPSPVDADRRDPTSVADSERQAADPRNRLFVIYLDLYHASRFGSRDANRPILDFLNRTIGASDLFGVLTPEIPVNSLTFGRRTDTVTAELTKYWNWGEADQSPGGTTIPRTPAEERLISCAFGSGLAANEAVIETFMHRHRQDAVYTSLESLIVRLRDIREERKNVLLLSGGWVPEHDRPELANAPTTTQIPTIGVGRGGQLGRGTPQTLNPQGPSCQAEFSRLANIDFVDRFRDIVSAAERANVSFYPVQLGGLTTGAIGTSQRGGRLGLPSPTALSPVEMLRTLANATDGFAVVNTNDLGEGLTRVADRLSAYYLLGYVSTNAVADGTFRKIDVKARPPGVSVAARRGYVAADASRVVAAAIPRAPATAPEFTAAMSVLSQLDARRELFAAAVVRRDSVDVTVELAAAEIGRGRWSAGADVSVEVATAAGEKAVAQGHIDADTRAVMVRVPLVASVESRRVRVRVTGDRLPAEEQFDVPVGAPPSSVLGVPATFRIASVRVGPRPVAEHRFRRGERLRIEVPVLGSVEQPSARLLDRRGQPLGTALGITRQLSKSGETTLVVELPVTLAEGDYAIEISAGEGPGVDRVVVPFRVSNRA